MMIECTRCHEDRNEDQYAVAYNKKRHTVCIPCNTGVVQVCKNCKVEKDLQTGFYLNQNAKYRRECIECAKARAKEHYFTNKDARGETQYWWRVKAEYGVTREQVMAKDKEQDGKCAICKKPFVAGVRPQVDHCHKTGDFRGLLCRLCNTGIGHLGDDLETVRSAVRYLEQYHKEIIPVKLKRRVTKDG